jgi:plastocyanin
MKSRWVGALAVALGAATVLGAGGARATSTSQVEIHEFHFTPSDLTVPVGTTVTWMNDDEETHTITASGGLFASPGLEHAETFARRFDTPGTYGYFCALHPHMTGAVIVR